MMARRPVGLSWQKTTCSWPDSALNTPMTAPRRDGVLVGRASRSPAGVRPLMIFKPSAMCSRVGPERGARINRASRYQMHADPCDYRDVPSLFASYLRVYEPLAAFDRERQLYWRRYVKEGRAVAPL